MKKIASFTIDHTILPRGMYVSRVDGDVTTYDIRMRRPNVEEVLTNGSIHTIEHLFATYVRNSEYTDNIIYFGPMGCRTGCYFLTRGMDGQDVINLTREAFRFIAEYEGEIPGEYGFQVFAACGVVKVNGEVSDIEAVAKIKGFHKPSFLIFPHIHTPVRLIPLPFAPPCKGVGKSVEDFST